MMVMVVVSVMAIVGVQNDPTHHAQASKYAYTVVSDWNAYQIPPDRHVPTPAGPVTNISTLDGCMAHCNDTAGCAQWAWNYGSSHDHVWYCEISSAKSWSGYPSDHIISGCLTSVENCGKVPPPPPPAPTPPPSPWTPQWRTIEPTDVNSTFGYPLLAPDKAVHTYVYYANSTFGTYNHGPMISFFEGLYWMEWYNGVKSEGVENRVLYSTSSDAIHWQEPAVMFNTTGPIGLENEPSVVIEGRRYAIGGSWDVFARTGGGGEHVGPDTPLMRRTFAPGSLGPVFWLGKEVPSGYEHFDYPTYLNTSQIDEQTRVDATNYLAALVDAEPLSDWGKPNERTMYQLPSDGHRLMALLRSGGAQPGEPSPGQHMLASSCVLSEPVSTSTSAPPQAQHTSQTQQTKQTEQAQQQQQQQQQVQQTHPTQQTSQTQQTQLTNRRVRKRRQHQQQQLHPQQQQQQPQKGETYHVCRPGTGLFNVGLPGDAMPPPSSSSSSSAAAATSSPSSPSSSSSSSLSSSLPLPTPWPGYHPVPVGHHCNWTAPIVTNIPDSHSRACTAPLPDGRIFLIGAQIPHGRDPVVLSISKDGLDWTKVWAVRNCVDASCKPRFGGPPGFQYPAAMWMLDGVRGPEIIFSYSVNKEDIALSRFPLSVLDE